MLRPACSYGFLAAAALLMAASTPALLRAQDAPLPDPDTPERGVARISVVNGEVSVRRGDSGDWVAAALNAPLMVEDRVSTGAGSRAEVQFDSANLIRIGAKAEVRLAQLDYGRYTLQIARGTVTFRVLRESHAQVELETPTVSVRPSHVGAYRIYVQEDGQTEITVRLGDVEIYTPKGTEQLQAGQTMLARGNPSDPEFRIVPAIAADQWDRWNEQRDRELLGSSSSQHVPQDVYGAEDLDSNGQWVDVPSYGSVWSPSVGPDWAPYQNGRWVWEDWYGWTWVSYDPWGWAPFHYGRWFYAANYGWCWYPGRFGHQYWSPALVGFFGFGGPGIGFGFGFGNIGWVALAPFETLRPWWGRGFYGRVGNFNHYVNVANGSIANTYRNARTANGVASIRAADFQQGRFGNISRVTSAQMRDVSLVRGQLPVAPSAANLRYTDRSLTGAPRSSENVHFFSHNTPPAVQRVPFGEQQRALQQSSRQSPTPATRSSSAGSTAGPARSAAPSVASSSNGSASGGWRRLNTPQSTSSNPGGSSSRTEQTSGWQRFGEPRPAAPAPRSYTTGWSTPRPGSSPGGYRPYAAPAGPNYSSPQSIRVAPPVVRERSAASSQTHSAPSSGSSASSHASHSTGGGGGGSHGGGGGHGGGGHR